MKIVVFGATGGTGTEIVRQALAAGHQVTAFVRDPAKLNLQHDNLSLFQGDVMDAVAVDKAIAGHEAVISALGPTRPPVAGMMETAARNIVDAMRKHGVRRLIATTGAGVRDAEDQPKLIDHVFRLILGLVSGAVLRDSEANAAAIRASDLDWTIVRYPRLTTGPRRGSYRVGNVGRNSGTQISRADGADFVLRELSEGRHIRQMPMVSY